MLNLYKLYRRSPDRHRDTTVLWFGFGWWGVGVYHVTASRLILWVITLLLDFVDATDQGCKYLRVLIAVGVGRYGCWSSG